MVFLLHLAIEFRKPMKILFNKIFLEHNPGSEIDGAYRLEKFRDLPDTQYNGESYISLVHPQEYIDKIKSACSKNEYMAEIHLSGKSYEAACQSVGLTVKASENEDFAVVRPAGHHAGIAKSHGFCLFNNIAIAAQKFVNEGKRVFLLDIDAHHGDGTQEIFYGSEKVLYCSIHEAFTFPFTGLPIERGVDDGMGYTYNFTLVPGSSDDEFLNVLDKVMAVASEFKPDIVGVSAGFDTYYKDKMMGLKYTDQAYFECGFRLRRTFRHVFAVLEGGYHEDLRKCVNRFVDGVNRGAQPTRIKFDDNLSIG